MPALHIAPSIRSSHQDELQPRIPRLSRLPPLPLHQLDQYRYDAAIAHAALTPDIELLPQHDLTFVGESGVQLSGGQRARVMFARALYSDADLLILDDIFSAVDMPTGRLLWTALAALRALGKTVVLATHQLQHLSKPEVRTATHPNA